MSEKINVSPLALESCCRTIRDCNKELTNCLNEIKAKMKASQKYWEGRSGESIRGEFEDVANRYFADYENQIEGYAAFLDRTAKAYVISDAEGTK